MSELSIHPLNPIIGAEVHGVDLSRPLDPETQKSIHDAWIAHQVIFFRDQDITPDEQLAFARQFGEISIPPFGPLHGDNPEFMVLDQKSPKGEGADVWHSDNTFMAEPPLGSILRAVKLPPVGGDTCFASSYAAYEALSPVIQNFLGELNAVHDLTRTVERANAAGHTSEDLDSMLEKAPPVEHPVVRTHPVTGRKGLYVNANSTTRIVELSPRENALWLPFLCDHIRSPEFQCRFRWEPNSIAFWDNRTVQHYAVPDYSERRVMHRVTLTGDKPR